MRMHEATELTTEIAREVEAYLASHPEGVDSVDGILRWWLPRVRLEETSAELQRALNLLVERGTLDCFEVPGGRVVYRRAFGPAVSRAPLEKP
jgi:hypothetical protein